MAETTCPICRRPVTVPAADEPAGFYPFCSDRCSLIDLGRWLKGAYQIPEDAPARADAPRDGEEPDRARRA